MESRKVQKVGAATLTISLPKEWAKQRSLKKGDQVYIVEDGEALKVLPGPPADGRHRAATEFIVDADLCEEPGILERVIVGNYVWGREKIIVRSALRLRSEHQDEVRRATRRLMGIGIIDESPSKVVLQCSIDPSNFPLEALIKRLYSLGATMLSESLEALITRDAVLADDALKREDDADMIYWLILRLVMSAQVDDALVERLGMRSRLEILGDRVISRDLEALADHCCDIARCAKEVIAQDVRVPGSIAKALQGLADAIGQAYGKALDGLFSRDLKLANEAIRLSAGLEKREQDLLRLVLKEFKDPRAVVPLRGIQSSLARIGEYAQSMAVIACNRYLEKPSNLCRPAMAPT